MVVYQFGSNSAGTAGISHKPVTHDSAKAITPHTSAASSSNVAENPPELPNRQSPYGPATSLVRRFLVQLADLDCGLHAAAVRNYQTESGTKRWQRAELVLAAVVERSGRDDAREALSGPLLQLLRIPEDEMPADVSGDSQQKKQDGKPETSAVDSLIATLDPIAEPALAAVLAVMVHDLLDEESFNTLYSPLAQAIPFETLMAAETTEATETTEAPHQPGGRHN